jgi:hypothetical protein
LHPQQQDELWTKTLCWTQEKDAPLLLKTDDDVERAGDRSRAWPYHQGEGVSVGVTEDQHWSGGCWRRGSAWRRPGRHGEEAWSPCMYPSRACGRKKWVAAGIGEG